MLSFLSYMRTLRPSSLPAFQSGSFINASLILAAKRLARSGIPKRTYNQPFRALPLSFIPYPRRLLFGIQQVSSSNVAHFLSQNIHTHISQTRFPDFSAFFVNVLLPRLLLFPFRSTLVEEYSLSFQSSSRLYPDFH